MSDGNRLIYCHIKANSPAHGLLEPHAPENRQRINLYYILHDAACTVHRQNAYSYEFGPLRVQVAKAPANDSAIRGHHIQAALDRGRDEPHAASLTVGEVASNPTNDLRRSGLVSLGPGATMRLVTTAADRILQDALGLPERERAEIAARLIESLEVARDRDAAEVEEAWAAEIERRCAALDAGTTGMTDWEEVRRRVEAEILRR
jgi:putative addiction module component (TIGR02574 family)